MVELYTIFTKINKGEHLSIGEIRLVIQNPRIREFQIVSLLFEILLKEPSALEHPLVRNWIYDRPAVAKYYNTLLQITDEAFHDFETQVISLLREKCALGATLVSELMRRILSKNVDLNFVATILVLIKTNGIDPEDTSLLTRAMVDSGKIYDYRNAGKLQYRKIVRRYPTGALSEKIALVMPSLLMAFARELKICSPFLVAKSLSFTGGTWDKLKALPGFTFPSQGNETFDMLRECNVSMTVTEGDFNPADKFLYQLRSLTNTVESSELIVSSIVSKQLAIPADSLILDVRYGPGSFLSMHNAAEELGARITTMLQDEGIRSRHILTDTIQPTGSSVGNYLEVLESIALMKNVDRYDNYIFNLDAINQQRALVVSMTVELLSLEFPDIQKNKLAQHANRFFESNIVFECFVKLLKCHLVKSEVIEAIIKSKHWNELGHHYSVIASHDGMIAEIRQKHIGSFVNFELGNGLNDITGGFNPMSGMILHVRLGEMFKKGDVLATIVHSGRLERDQLRDQNYFTIKT